MALYTNESRDRVRDAVDFVELVSARTELRRAGPARYEGLCPFHEERTPSFGIDPSQKVYHCFGCQASGDLFTFVQETEGVDFKGALELLADRYGVELEREQEDPREAEKRKREARLFELLDRTAAYYERVLWESPEASKARDYLLGRGLSEETLKEFRVGYAPSAWDRVLMASRRERFSAKELYATGLAQRSKQNGQLYDRFRSRIMFPLANLRGRVLGFGARAMRPEQRPKYLNTSDNELYHKGQQLYGAHLARPHAARAGRVIVCEGYTDVIALHQAGLRETVGLMGTALTAEQVGELARMAHTVLLALDADTAGQEAMLRAFELAQKRKLDVRVVPLAEGTDPAELVQRDGPDAMKAVVESSVPFIRFSVERVLANGDDTTSEGQDRMIEQLRPIFAQLPPSVTRADLMELVARRFAQRESILEQRLSASATHARSTAAAGSPAGRVKTAGDGHLGPRGGGLATGDSRAGARARASTPPGSPSGRDETERAFLALCIASPEAGAQALAQIDADDYFSSELLRRAARHLQAADLNDPLVPHGAGGARLEDDPELGGLLAELVVAAGRDNANPAMLEVQRLQLELSHVERQIRQARGRQSGAVSDLAQRKATVKREFDRAYGRVLEQTGEREG